jgi:hypothetical protein
MPLPMQRKVTGNSFENWPKKSAAVYGYVASIFEMTMTMTIPFGFTNTLQIKI